MPRSTWANLPEAKRARVLDAAMAEFGLHGFSAGSLNVIAREAGIAKGSLFQYFHDKLELFAVVCEEVSGRILAALVGEVNRLAGELPFFDALGEIFAVWVAYFSDHPLERGVTAATNLEIDGDVRTAVRAVAHRHYLEVLRPLVEGARDAGDLRADADLDALLASLLLLLPHLALAPYVPSLDPVLGMYGRTPADLTPTLARLLEPLRRGYGTPADAPEPLRREPVPSA